MNMPKWKLHIPDDSNRIVEYKCGLAAGQLVRLKKQLVVTCKGKPTGKVHPVGEEWIVLSGVKTDPVLWFQEPDGERCTWDDDKKSVEEWFELINRKDPNNEMDLLSHTRQKVI